MSVYRRHRRLICIRQRTALSDSVMMQWCEGSQQTDNTAPTRHARRPVCWATFVVLNSRQHRAVSLHNVSFHLVNQICRGLHQYSVLFNRPSKATGKSCQSQQRSKMRWKSFTFHSHSPDVATTVLGATMMYFNRVITMLGRSCCMFFVC